MMPLNFQGRYSLTSTLILMWFGPRLEPSGGGGTLWIWPWRLIHPSSNGTIGRCENNRFTWCSSSIFIASLIRVTPCASQKDWLRRSWLPWINNNLPFNIPVNSSKWLFFPNAKSPKWRMVSSGDTRSFQFLTINSCQCSGRLQYLPIFSWKKWVSEMIHVSGVISNRLSAMGSFLYSQVGSAYNSLKVMPNCSTKYCSISSMECVYTSDIPGSL